MESCEMETSTTDESSNTFKIPQSFPIQEDSTIKSADEDNAVTTDSAKENDSDSKKKISKRSPVDVVLPYREPDWSGTPPPYYSFEIIKNGTVVETYNIRDSYIVFGRLEICNLVFEHPSVSRFHAIVQYCQGDSTHAKGFYLYDLGSTHGTFLNKKQITPKIYYKLKVGYVLKFGGSTRLHIFQGPEEEESEEKIDTPKVEEDVCTWGMGEDAEEEEDDLSENPFAVSTPNEDLYLEDPKKTLKNWFEREGYDLEYDVEEKGFKTFVCRVQLPVDTPTGDFMPVEASVSGKKKEAVIACALEACRTLDRLGLLRQSHQESRQRKKKKWEENDYYDSDEDTFLDRTGTIEKKREMRKKIEKKNAAETYESIEASLKMVSEEIDEIRHKLSVSQKNAASENNSEDSSEADSLEAFMSSLSDNKEMASDKIERRKLRFLLQEAEKDKIRLEKLLNIAKPNKLPPVVKYPGMIGKRVKSKLQIPSAKPEKVPTSPKLNDNEEEEEESDTENIIVESSKDSSPPAQTIEREKKESNIKSYGLILNVGQKEHESSSNTKQNESMEDFSMRVIGCGLPEQFQSSNEDISRSKKKRKSKQSEQNVDVYSTGNADYSTWVPPAGQSGDGVTHLNAKYGY